LLNDVSSVSSGPSSIANTITIEDSDDNSNCDSLLQIARKSSRKRKRGEDSDSVQAREAASSSGKRQAVLRDHSRAGGSGANGIGSERRGKGSGRRSHGAEEVIVIED
jgi:hypothetical protein